MRKNKVAIPRATPKRKLSDLQAVQEPTSDDAGADHEGMCGADGSASGGEPIRVTLLRNKKTKSILYMEAGKNFVDLLLSFLTLPTGTVLKLLTAANSKPPGAISNVFDSVKHLEKSSLYVGKDVLLEQKPFCPAFSNFGVLRIEPSNSRLGKGPAKTYLRCRCSGLLKSEIMPVDYACDSCDEICRTPTRVVFLDGLEGASASVQGAATAAAEKPAKAGIVRKSLNYSITNDLQIRPASTINIITLLSSMKVDALMSDLESFETTVGPNEAVLLLQSSLSSQTALDDVFGPQGSSRCTLVDLPDDSAEN